MARMTDNDIIKVLECCKNNDCDKCFNSKVKPHNQRCNEVICENALDLINRQKEQIDGLINGQETLQKYIAEQKAEIERLKSVIDCYEETSGNKKARVEAITEFEEKLKDMHKHNKTSVVSLVTIFDNINQIAKEMKEGLK